MRDTLKPWYRKYLETPENRCETRVITPQFEEARKRTQFPPGVSGNAHGRPPKRLVTDEYEKVLAMKADDVNPLLVEELRKRGFKIPKGATIAFVVAMSQGGQAMTGKTKATSEIREAVEGKARQRIELAGLTTTEEDGTETTQPVGAPRSLTIHLVRDAPPTEDTAEARDAEQAINRD